MNYFNIRLSEQEYSDFLNSLDFEYDSGSFLRIINFK